MKKSLKTEKILYFLLILLPIIDNIYKFQEGASPAVIVRAIVTVLMIFMLFRVRPLGQSQNHIVRTIIFLLTFIFVISLLFSQASWVFYSLIRLSYPFLGFILFYYLTKNSFIDENAFATFYMILIFVMAINSYINIDFRMSTVKELNEADNIGYGLLCVFAGIMLLTEKKIFPFVLFLVLVGTFISGKRGAIVGVLFSAIPLVKFVFISHSRSWIKKIILLLIAILGIFLAIYLFGAYFDAAWGRFEYISEDGGSGRNWVYSSYWNQYKASDLSHQLFGHGLYAGTLSYGNKHAFIHVLAHNDWLEILFDYGMIGFLLYLFLFIKLTTIVICKRKENNAYYYMLVMSFIIWFVKSILSSTFLVDISSIYVYITTAFAIAKLEQKQYNIPKIKHIKLNDNQNFAS